LEEVQHTLSDFTAAGTTDPRTRCSRTLPTALRRPGQLGRP
jgi:hypothetical protein